MLTEEELGKIYVEVEARLDKFDRELRAFERKTKRDAEKMGKSFGGMFSKGLLKGGAVIAIITAVKKAWDFSVVAKNFARDAAEIDSKFNVVFSGMQDKAAQWAKTFGGSVGRATTNIKKFTSEIGDVLKPLGFMTKRAFEASKELTKLALEVASFNNVSDAQVIHSFISALTGERESLKSLGIVISEADVKQEAYNSGLAKQGEELSKVARAQATMNLLFKNSKDAQGDLLRTSDSLANLEKQLDAQFQELYETLGKELIPVFSTATKGAIAFIKSFTTSESDRAIERLQQLGIEAEKLNAILETKSAIKTAKRKIELKTIIKGEDNSFSSRIDRIKELSLEWEQIDDVRKSLTMMRDDTVKLTEKEAKLSAVKERLIELYKQQALRSEKGYDTSAINQLITKREFEFNEMQKIISAYKELELLEKKVDAPAKKKNKGNEENKKGLKENIDLLKDEVALYNEIYYSSKKWYDKSVELIRAQAKEMVDAGISKADAVKWETKKIDELTAAYERMKIKAGEVATAVANVVYPGKLQGVKQPKLPGIDLNEREKNLINDLYSAQKEAAFDWADAVTSASEIAKGAMDGFFDDMYIKGEWANSMLEKAFVGMANAFITQVQRMITQWLAWQAIKLAFSLVPGGSAVLTALSTSTVGAAAGGTYNANSQGIQKMATGGSFIVPTGHPTDTYPLLLRSGEQATITPQHQVGRNDEIMTGIYNRLGALTEVVRSQKQGDVTVVTNVGGRTIAREVHTTENRLIRQNVQRTEDF